jgi:hypothetical protein
MNSGATPSLEAIWASSADNVFTVGSNGTILHFESDLADAGLAPICIKLTPSGRGESVNR